MSSRSCRVGLPIAVLATVTLLACANPFAKPEPDAWPGPVITGACTVERLALPAEVDPDAPDIEITDMDATGRYVVGDQRVQLTPMPSLGPIQRQLPILWKDGVARVVDVPGDSGTLVAVNSRGWAAGLTDGLSEGWVLMPGSGELIPLRSPVGAASYPIDMNERGDVLGAASGSGGRYAGAVWSPNAPGGFAARPLTMQADSFPRGITDDGTVLGAIRDPSGDRPYVWEPDGRGHEVRLPGSVRFDLWVAIDGDWALAQVDSGLLRWNVHSGEWSTMDFFNADKTRGAYPAVSPRGVAFGGRPAYLVLDGDAYELPFPPDTPPNDRIAMPSAISGDGAVVSGVVQASPTSNNNNFQRAPVIWRCKGGASPGG
ncbi:MAG TPA: hypothetical protein VH561_18570 [Micromonosporaceae bacterium]|jgi:hypothetical protein